MSAVRKKKRQWCTPIIALIGINLLFVLGHMYQYVLFVKATRTKQQIEKQFAGLQEKKQQRSQEFEAMKSRCMIRHYAAKELGMKSVSLKQVKKFESCDECFDS